MAEKRNNQVFGFIVRFFKDHRRPPSQREIARGVGLRSVSSVKDRLKDLEAAGLIKVEPGSHRGITISDDVPMPEERPGG